MLKLMWLVMVIQILIYAAIVGGVGFVVWHFASKMW